MIMNMAYGGGTAVSGKLLSTLNVGDTLEVPVVPDAQPRFGMYIVWKVADKNHTGYPANSVTLITDRNIQFMCADAREPNNSNDSRKSYGNNRHIHSNLLQWLNSDAAAGEWYTKQHDSDMYPSENYVESGINPYREWAGFLAIFGADFVSKLLDTTLTVLKVTVDGKEYDTFTRKVFLASRAEVGDESPYIMSEGAPLALFSDNASRQVYPTIECVYNTEHSSATLSPSNPTGWWLRTPDEISPESGSKVRYVSSNGALTYTDAYDGGVGVRPLCNLPGSLRVSESPNVTGNYTIMN